MPRRAAEMSAATVDVPAGSTVTQSGSVQGVTLETGGTLSVAGQSTLSVFGAITGPSAGTASVTLGDQAMLFAAAAVDAGVTIDLASQDTLDLGQLQFAGFLGSIAGLGPGNVLDIASTAITATALSSDTRGGTDLTLLDDGTAIGTLHLTEASGPGLLAAVPDGNDGTLILAGPAMPPPSATAAPGTQDGSFQWRDASGGQWSDAANWGAASAPGAGDAARIDGPSDALLPIAGAAAAASLTVSGDVALAGSFALGSLVIASDVLDVAADATVTTGTAILQNGVWQVAGGDVEINGLATLSGGLLDVVDGGMMSTAGMVLAGATLTVDTAASVAVGTGSGVEGATAVTSGGTLSGFGTLRGAIQDDGLLSAQGGTLASFGAIAGAGQVVIGPGATLFAAQGIAASVNVSFAPSSGPAGGSGTLELFAPIAGFAATLTGMQPGDALDFAAGTVTQAVWTPPGPADGGIGVLDLGAVGSIAIGAAAGVDPAAVAFAIADDGTGGTRVAMVPCFVAGTRLVTPAGEVAVEAIQVGDRVLTGSGAWRRVRWIGRARHDADALRAEPQLRPVRIAAGALGDRTPARQLRLSPQHALLFATRHGEVLVPAVALVDGVAVTRCPSDDGVTYLHIELDSHDVVVAEGALTETYLPESDDSRLLFHAPEPSGRAPSGPCRRRIEGGPVVMAVRRRLGLRTSRRGAAAVKLRGNLERAAMIGGMLQIEGWALDEAEPEAPVRIEILHEGIACGQAIADLWRPDLDRARLAGGSCAFVAELPWRAADLHGRLSVRPAGGTGASVR